MQRRRNTPAGAFVVRSRTTDHVMNRPTQGMSHSGPAAHTFPTATPTTTTTNPTTVPTTVPDSAAAGSDSRSCVVAATAGCPTTTTTTPLSRECAATLPVDALVKGLCSIDNVMPQQVQPAAGAAGVAVGHHIAGGLVGTAKACAAGPAAGRCLSREAGAARRAFTARAAPCF